MTQEVRMAKILIDVPSVKMYKTVFVGPTHFLSHGRGKTEIQKRRIDFSERKRLQKVNYRTASLLIQPNYVTSYPFHWIQNEQDLIMASKIYASWVLVLTFLLLGLVNVIAVKISSKDGTCFHSCVQKFVCYNAIFLCMFR